ncbi:free fatty acid receptor 2-like [Paramacrobiotus metropolitanus]|uniref:free fatty acid receptor 2-like n=1 Tax=Paramacrobiotus metropolitanus TaxID=2943436 RepID=UPI002445E1BA|nr:free fatty acid receptor 2-like [Paramacrobiotus metropolitanus]
MNSSYLFSVQYLNVTIEDPEFLGWTFYPAAKLFLLITGIIFNAACLFLSLTTPSFRNAFAVYLLAVLSSNLLTLLIYYPLSIIQDLYSQWPLNHALCGVLLYGNLVSRSLCLHFHGLITLNRYWAILAPLSYRVHHAPATAVTFCGVSALYLHATEVTAIVLDFRLRRWSIEQANCYLDVMAQRVYIGVIYAVNYGVALLVIAAYPYVLWTHVRQKRKVVGAEVQRGAGWGLAITLLTGSVLVCWVPHGIMMFVLFVREESAQLTGWEVAWLLNMLQPLLDPLIFFGTVEPVRENLLGRWRRLRKALAA